VIGFDGERIEWPSGWQVSVESHLRAQGDVYGRARVAAALQAQLGDAFVAFLARVAAAAPDRNLCLGGSFFHHSSMNTRIEAAGLFECVFVPANPGNAGAAVGSALATTGRSPAPLSPFMGPAYDPDRIKWTLDNCKLPYSWCDEGEILSRAVHELLKGRLVGWYEGRMEWGPRALGARSILASPFSPYVLENLNRFLKRREAWRGYSLSTPADAVRDNFDGPPEAPFMECDYRPLDVSKFRFVLPSESATVRVQTVTDRCPPRFQSLLRAFGEACGTPCLVNTSFNGFHEPIVCTPRDAVRVFFGSGLDVLFLDRFVLMK
jgi:carbamoyltransferase